MVTTPRRTLGTARRRRGTRAAGQGTRERILTAALESFSQAGFDGTTTRDLAARAGVNLGLIKYYFDSKEKLWRAAVEQAASELQSTLAAAVPGTVETRADLVRIEWPSGSVQ